MPLFKVGSVLDLSFYQELENSFFSYDDLDFFKKYATICRIALNELFMSFSPQ